MAVVLTVVAVIVYAYAVWASITLGYKHTPMAGDVACCALMVAYLSRVLAFAMAAATLACAFIASVSVTDVQTSLTSAARATTDIARDQVLGATNDAPLRDLATRLIDAAERLI